MKIVLSADEARVIGCLIEKQNTTPDQYPLSLNALVNACNQKSNRDPLMSLDEPMVQQVVNALVRKHMVLEKSGFGSRVPKFQQIFCNTQFGSLKFTPLETAIVCELMLRGPQTPGELRTRCSRMAPVGDGSDVEAALQSLQNRTDGAVVVKLPREPNRRDARWAHLFSGEVHVEAATDDPAEFADSNASKPTSSSRLDRLEELVDQLQAEIEALKTRLG